ncbi:MAG: patatin-like phospholipase family protein [Acidimicrobiia bacterium]|nr:patatin-like phospholipase family protein [Acidimicrobiia bacterium]
MSVSQPGTDDRGFIDRARRFARRALGRRTVAFVLSGGGNLGAVQVGMLRALAEADVVPDLIVGCSVGAINGAAFAAEPDQRGVERLDRIWGRIADGDPDLMPSSRFVHPTVQMARRGESIHSQSRLEQLLDEELTAKTFKQLRIPFSCVATDVDTAEEVWFDQGRIVPALLASAALPAVYPARSFAGRNLIDGGVLREIHVHQAVALGATELYVLHVGHLDQRPNEVQRPFDSAMRAYWTARRYRFADDMRRIPDHCVVHRMPAGSSPVLRFDDFTRGRELAELAYEASSSFLQTGRTPRPVEGPTSDQIEELDEDLAEQFANETDLGRVEEITEFERR